MDSTSRVALDGATNVDRDARTPSRKPCVDSIIDRQAAIVRLEP
jgi:hypothetical protein